jgi:hypothetical protein
MSQVRVLPEASGEKTTCPQCVDGETCPVCEGSSQVPDEEKQRFLNELKQKMRIWENDAS